MSTPYTEEKKIKNGKTELILICAIAVILSLFIITIYNITIGHERLPYQVFRVVMSILLMALTLNGIRFFKWTLIFSFVYSTVEYSKNIGLFLSGGWFGWVMFSTGCYNIFFVLYLLLSKNINFYLEHQHKLNTNTNTKNTEE